METSRNEVGKALARRAETDRVPHPCGFQRAGFDVSGGLPSYTKQKTYFLSDQFASVDCSSLNFRPVYPACPEPRREFSRGYPLESTRFKSFYFSSNFARQRRYFMV